MGNGVFEQVGRQQASSLHASCEMKEIWKLSYESKVLLLLLLMRHTTVSLYCTQSIKVPLHAPKVLQAKTQEFKSHHSSRSPPSSTLLSLSPSLSLSLSLSSPPSLSLSISHTHTLSLSLPLSLSPSLSLSLSLNHSHRLRKTNTRPPPPPPPTKRLLPTLQKTDTDPEQVLPRRPVRAHERSDAVLHGAIVRFSFSFSHCISCPLDLERLPLLQLSRQRLVAHQPRKRRRQEPKVEIERVDRKGLAAEADRGHVLRARGARVREESLRTTAVAVAVAGDGQSEGAGHEVEDCVCGGGGREHERGAGVDDGLAAGGGAGGDAGDGDGVEDDLPVGGLGDGDLGRGARVAGWVAAA